MLKPNGLTIFGLSTTNAAGCAGPQGPDEAAERRNYWEEIEPHMSTANSRIPQSSLFEFKPSYDLHIVWTLLLKRDFESLIWEKTDGEDLVV